MWSRDFSYFTNNGAGFDIVRTDGTNAATDVRTTPLDRFTTNGIKNRLPSSETLSNWTANSVTATSGLTDPFGGTRAYRLNRQNVNDFDSLVSSTVDLTGAGKRVYLSFYAKTDT